MENNQSAIEPVSGQDVLSVEYSGENAQKGAELLRKHLSRNIMDIPPVIKKETKDDRLDAGTVVIVLVATVATRAVAKVTLKNLEEFLNHEIANREFEGKLKVVFQDENKKQFRSKLYDFSLEMASAFISELKSVVDKL